jgi:hypothetical protein
LIFAGDSQVDIRKGKARQLPSLGKWRE